MVLLLYNYIITQDCCTPAEMPPYYVDENNPARPEIQEHLTE